jgi:hypothetical protein
MRRDESDRPGDTWRVVIGWALWIVAGLLVASLFAFAAVVLPFAFTNV